MEATILKPKVFVRLYKNISYNEMLKVIRARRSSKKYGFLEAAYDVEQLNDKFYNVRMEYIV